MSKLRSGILVIAAMSAAVSISHAEPFSNTKGSASTSSTPSTPPLPADQFKQKVIEQSKKTLDTLSKQSLSDMKMEPPKPPGSAQKPSTKPQSINPDQQSSDNESPGMSSTPPGMPAAPPPPPQNQNYTGYGTGTNNTTSAPPAQSGGSFNKSIY